MKVKKKPIIGILANIETMDKDPFLGKDRTTLNQDYIHAIMKAGGIPLVLPVIDDLSIIKQQIDLIDGLMITGGYDVHPHLYGEEPHPDIGFIRADRDKFEIRALGYAYEKEKPIFGICRGLQLINVAFKGTLYQDISQHSTSDRILHTQKAKLHEVTHRVNLTSGSLLQDIFKKKIIGTNSFHHQAIKQIAPGFLVSARTKDGIIEGIEKKDYPFLVAVQWHPERMVDTDPDMLKLFEVFVARCRPRS